MEGTRKPFRIVTVALAFGGLGLILATMLYAFGLVDERALQAFKASPPVIQPETATDTVGSAADPAASGPMPITQQPATGQTTRISDPMNTQRNVHRKAHHGSKTPGKRLPGGSTATAHP